MNRLKTVRPRACCRTVRIALASLPMVAFFLWGGVLSCATQPTGSVSADADIAFVTLDRGQQSGIMDLECVSVESDDAWLRLLERHRGSRMPGGEEVFPDFSRESVLAVFLGQRNTSGYSVEITNVREADDHVDIRYRERTPDPEGMVGMVITSPYHIVRTRKLGLSARCLPEPSEGFRGAQGRLLKPGQ